MTEQEKREKRIEEMESDICNGCKYYKGKDFCCICDVISYAKTLVGLHYRKEEEVQKETAKKILQEIASPYYSVGDVYELTRHDIQKLAEKFGVEVEE